MSEFDAVLIYDGECPYCSIAARALERTQRVGAVSWYDDAAQSFLAAQFGETPFAMVLADREEGRVYAGREAARELAERAGFPGAVGSTVGNNYDAIAGFVGKLTGRDREMDPYHDTYDLTDAAREQFDDVAAVATAGPPWLGDSSGSNSQTAD